ncbi:lacI family transcriptional regulator [Ligilactobacillus acidipiscis DSM 15836]|uniref:LacI family transcriptional regulator n=1 Tax=Ligilactobacillus acidipiscis DSM 15836 TaxID=1423716 RepID=A0ABR5PIX3_9LACO|nr:LacI family DNA-binding transcriptional regulator [Ligilactobacillus acidipiscis]KRM23262.1 lacI family transcriptional regulator [Ligilactobacillus acidipiscis DSM 15836]GAW65158.1 LacI family transcriptional regulator [Ligilactobacillus acidipiscis]GEN21445.1 LacI family transcriptional regulator [Ligilactobacillus acidipiscis]
MSVTIKDIAIKAGVSTATVSRVLNNQVNFFTEKTEKKVKKAALQLGYQKNVNAVELVTKNSKTIGVVISDTRTNFASDIIKGIHFEALKQGLNVIMTFGGENDPELQKQALKTVTERPVKYILLVGLEITSENLAFLKNGNIPYLFISTEFEKESGIPFITTENFNLAYAGTKFLIEKGYRKIGLAGVDINSHMGKQRLDGFRKALESNEITCLPEWVQPGNFSYQDGINSMKQYHKNGGIEAVFCGSDYVAWGILNQAQKLGIKIPAELGVMSMDGTKLTHLLQPQITSVVQEFYQMGIEGVKAIVTGPTANFSHHLPFKIVERNSTK